jgi:hypothetical protein
LSEQHSEYNVLLDESQKKVLREMKLQQSGDRVACHWMHEKALDWSGEKNNNKKTTTLS